MRLGNAVGGPYSGHGEEPDRVDDQEPEAVLPNFVERVAAAGCEVFIVHARKAWLQGLSPKENRDVPPLDYGLSMR